LAEFSKHEYRFMADDFRLTLAGFCSLGYWGGIKRPMASRAHARVVYPHSLKRRFFQFCGEKGSKAEGLVIPAEVFNLASCS
jgi:hypothetical protein